MDQLNVPKFIDKSLIITELEFIISTLQTNLFYNNISLKAVYPEQGNAIITPKIDILFSN